MERLIRLLKSPAVWYLAGIGDAAILYGLYLVLR